MLNLVIVSTLLWIAQDQFQRIDFVPHQVSLALLSAVWALLVASVTWQARGRWCPASIGAVVLTIGMQVGRFISDVISGVNWSGSDYWWFWGSAWSFLLAVNASLVLLLLFPIRWVQRRQRDA